MTFQTTHHALPRGSRKLLQEEWQGQLCEGWMRGHTVPQSQLEVIRCYTIRVIRWRAERDWEIAECDVEKVLSSSAPNRRSLE
jgi:hypothetical protein